jgi:restriction system protein
MTPEGLEHFCGELLERVGVEEVQVTNFVRDHGIDGKGNLRINEFVTVPIAFQAKKLDKSGAKGSSEDIQRFRGAMGRRIEKGIFFTTTTFTEEAKKEAQRADHVVIELVDLERILEICERYRIGLEEEKILVPMIEWFSRFRVRSR